ncbi:MAG TPA: dihydroorotate dehydrogenase [Phycisphaerae bacterium]|nr:dihydroorotate dehydrogenase [Phycisphaerae bacterium]
MTTIASPVSTAPSLAVNIGKLRLQNPMMTASGTCGYANEYGDFTDMTRLGAFVTKAISKTPRKGNESIRVIETRAGMLNAIGLANIGLEVFLRDKIPLLKKMGVPVIVNVPGWTTEDYVDVSAALDQQEVVGGIELNVSCPNVKKGMMFGTDPARLFELVSAVKKVVHRCELIVKLSPNVADVAETARAAVDAGATCLSLVNTFTAMVIDIEKQRPMLANATGGLSGPAIKPIAVFMTHRVYTEVAKKHNIPLIGMGGIQRWQDAVEFLLAGATGLAVGTALFLDPNIPVQILAGLEAYLARKGHKSITEIIGTLKPPAPLE